MIMILVILTLISISTCFATENQEINKEVTLQSNSSITSEVPTHNPINKQNIKKEDSTKHIKSSPTNKIENQTINNWLKTYNDTIIENCQLTNITNFGNLKIINCTFDKVKSDNILIYNKGNLTLINTTIKNSSSHKYLVYGANITQISNCSFINNRIKEESNSSTLYRFQNTVIENSVFNNNYGGIYGINLKIKNCTFNNNIKNNTNFAAHNGGAIITTGNTTITNSTFYNNTIQDNGEKLGVGGAIYNTGILTSTNNNYTSNNASKAGTIYNKGKLNSKLDIYHRNTANHYDIIINMNNCKLLNCNISALWTDYRNTSKLYNYKDMEIKNCKIFSLRNTQRNGKAIYGDLTYFISKTDNIIYNTGTLSLIHNSITENYGGIYSTGNLHLVNNSLFNNFNINNSFITIKKANLTFTNNKFTRNHIDTDKTMSFIYCNHSLNCIIDNNNFTRYQNNLIYSNYSNVEFVYNNLNNSVYDDIYCVNSNMSVITNYRGNMSIVNNTLYKFSKRSGYLNHIISNQYANMNVTNNIFDSMYLDNTNNSVIKTTYDKKISYAKMPLDYSSAIYCHHGNITINNNIFHNITSRQIGSCIILNRSNASITNNNFTNTSVKKMYYYVYDNITNNMTKYLYNSYGGSIYIKNSRANITNNNFTNTSGGYGGCICYVNEELFTNYLWVKNNRFINNTAYNYGSSLYCKGDVNIDQNKFKDCYDNSTPSHNTIYIGVPGNSVYFWEFYTTVENNTFSYNKNNTIRLKGPFMDFTVIKIESNIYDYPWN